MTLDNQALDRLVPSAPARGHRWFMRPSLWLAAGVLVLAGFLLLRLRAMPSEADTGTAPDFEVVTFDGQSLRLSDLRGQVVFLNFWASWCRPCREEAPVLQAIAVRYAGSVTVLGIAYADTDTGSRAFIEEFGLTYPTAPDTDGEVSSLYRLLGVPQTFVIDQQGNLVDMLIGATQVNVENLSTIIRNLTQQE